MSAARGNAVVSVPPTLRLAALVLGAAVAALVPVVVSPFYVFVASRVLLLALFAVAYNLVFGYGGMPSLGHAAFFGVGGYLVGLGATRWDWGFATIAVLTIVGGALLGVVFGVLTLRTNGVYLLLLTLAVGQSLWALAFQQVELTGGDNGISGLTRASVPLGLEGDTAFYYFVLVVVAASLGLLALFVRSPVGMAIVGARESESRMASLGYNVGAYRTVAFVVSGVFSALAGMLTVYLQVFVNPENLHWPTSANVMIFAIFGGASAFLGPALGALALVSLETWVSTYTERWITVLGLVYIVTILFLPAGLTGLLRRLWGLTRRDRSPQEAEMEQDATLPVALAHGQRP